MCVEGAISFSLVGSAGYKAGSLEQAWPTGPERRVTIAVKMKERFCWKGPSEVSRPTLAQSRGFSELWLWFSSSCFLKPGMGVLSRSLFHCCHRFMTENDGIALGKRQIPFLFHSSRFIFSPSRPGAADKGPGDAASACRHPQHSEEAGGA